MFLPVRVKKLAPAWFIYIYQSVLSINQNYRFQPPVQLLFFNYVKYDIERVFCQTAKAVTWLHLSLTK